MSATPAMRARTGVRCAETVKKPCPCTSGLAYRDCCAAYHRGEREAPTPEALLRSRFAAFALRDAEYVWRTLHPDHEDRARPKDEVLRSIAETAQALRYMRLTVLDADGPRVLFRAGIFHKGQDRSFVELSDFARDASDGPWRYRSGEARRPSDVEAAQATTIAAWR